MTDKSKVPHEYEKSRVGHGEAQCKWCLGTNRENAIIAPNHCDKRAEDDPSLTSQPAQSDLVEYVGHPELGTPDPAFAPTAPQPDRESVLREAAGTFAFEQRDDDKPDGWNEACDHIANAFRHEANPFGRNVTHPTADTQSDLVEPASYDYIGHVLDDVSQVMGVVVPASDEDSIRSYCSTAPQPDRESVLIGLEREAMRLWEESDAIAKIDTYARPDWDEVSEKSREHWRGKALSNALLTHPTTDTQSDAVRELAWRPIGEYPVDRRGRPVEAVDDSQFLLVIAPELLDEDFNPTGIGQAHYQDDGTIDEHVEPGAWVAPKWCNCHDEYHLRVVNPSHFAFVSRSAIRHEAADAGEG